MATLNLQDVALQQENKEVDGVEYMFTAWPATYSLDFMEIYQKELEEGKASYKLMKEVICSSVSKDNKQITTKSFDIIFSRKIGHLVKVYQEVLKYNLDDLFTLPDSEE